MNTSYEIRNWLERAFIEPVDRINECYYYDRRNTEFFSVYFTDYFLTDPNKTEEYAGSPYSQEELAILSERIERLEEKSDLLLSIPRLTIQERKEMMCLFIDNHEPLNKTELQTIADAENGRSNLDFNGKVLPGIHEDWHRFRYDYIQNKVDTFCNLNNIDLDAATLWTDQKMTSITINLKDSKDTIAIQPQKPKSPWWKFW